MDFKFNLGDKVKVTKEKILGTVLTRSYTEYLDCDNKQQSFKEYQIETVDKYYQCNEDELEMFENVTWKESDKIDSFVGYEKCGSETQNNEEVEDVVNHPSHYTDTKIEVMDYIEDKGFNFALGNTVKYISRAGKKDPNKKLEDLKKAMWYLNREIERVGKENE